MALLNISLLLFPCKAYTSEIMAIYRTGKGTRGEKRGTEPCHVSFEPVPPLPHRELVCASLSVMMSSPPKWSMLCKKWVSSEMDFVDPKKLP